ncbi:MAG: TonB-dependent receptor plug domain-containing protein [Bacteroidota bacterium]|nr:TonB-dependent receptor plug domain-containing protein [Bacteroidota bacterium]
MQAKNIWNKLSLLVGVVFIIHTAHSQDYRSNSRRHRVETPDTTGNAEGALNSRILYGTVRSLMDNEFLALASIKELGTQNIVYTNDQGVFFIKLNLTNRKAALVCVYNGFENDTAWVDETSTYINFKLTQKYEVIKEIIVSASRKRELKFESPATVETIDPKQLQYNPGLNSYDRITNLAGVDAITTSFNFKVINTRGFNSAYNLRFIQRYDNMELALPGFSTTLVQLNGPIDLDIEKTELVAGASGALYGPNALNGLTNTSSKNPFQYKGMSANFKTGMNHVDGIDEQLSPFYDLSLRYANTINKKLAYKVVINYMKGKDWHASDYNDISDYSTSRNNTDYGYKPGAGNPGYDGVNVGGDEEYKIFDSTSKILGPPTNVIKKPLKIARTGYKESEVLNYDIYSFKTDAGIYYRPNKNTEISWTSRLGMGNANFQTENRTQVQNFIIQMHKLEAKNRNHVFRTYLSAENAGTSYDFNSSAIKINQGTKNDQNWYVQYLLAYTGQYNNLNNAKNLGLANIPAGDDAAARKFADGDNTKLSALYKLNFPQDAGLSALMAGQARLTPGTKEFDSAFNYVTTHNDSSGSQFYSHSKVLYSEYIYDFKDVFKKFSLLAGTNFRLYAPNTQGSFLTDKNTRIYSKEIGGFVQAGKDFYDKRIKVQASARVDKMQRFDLKLSPRISGVFLLGKRKQYNVRMSAQIGYKMPSLYDQFNNIFIPRLRNFGAFYQTAVDLGLIHKQPNGPDFINVYTQNSVNQYLASGDSRVLVKPSIKDLKPEEVKAFEIGWRGFTFKKFETDIVLYYNRYQNLITSQQYIGPANPSKTQISAALLSDQRPHSTIFYRRSINSQIPVNTYGTTVSTNYYYSRRITVFGNYTYNILQETNEYLAQDFIVRFNTPKNKFNVGINGTKLWKKIGFSAIYRWVQGYYYEEYTKKGNVPSYYTLDIAFTYHLSKKYNTMLKLGGSNVTNVRYVQSIGGPTVGAIFYFSILYDDLLK